MLRKMFVTVALVVCVLAVSAQKDSLKTKKLDHYFGVQVNQLFRQVINLNNSTNNTISNPYQLIYSLNLAKSGWGVNAGIGYDYQKITDKESPANHESRINDLFYRVGVGRKIMFAKRFNAGWSLDFAGSHLVDKTVTVSVTDFGSGVIDSVSSEVTSKTVSLGGGAQVSLAFQISNRVSLGTESTFYYLKSKEKQNVLTTDIQIIPFNNTRTVTSTNSNFETGKAEFDISLPVALFLILKF